MSIVFRFNRYILAPIIIEWLTLMDFANFDSALCNVAERIKYLDLCLNFPQLIQRCMFESERGFPVSFTMFHWRLYRGLRDWDGFVVLSDEFLRNIVGMSVINNWFSVWDHDCHLSNIERCFSHLRRINVEYCPRSYSSTLCKLLKICCNLEDLHLGQISDVEEIVRTISVSCLKIKILKIDCNFDMRAKTMISLLQCSELREFHFPHICRLSKSFMEMYDVDALSHLIFFIDIGQEYLVTSVHSANLIAYRPRFFSQSEFRFYLLNGGGINLTKLDLSLISHPAGSFLHLIGSNCPNLTDIFMPEDRSTEVYFETVVSTMPNLLVLNVTKLRAFGVTAVNALGRRCPLLTDLSLNNGIPEIGSCLPLLRKLFVTYNFMVINTLLRDDLNTILCRCRHLTHISIPVVDDSMLAMIATYCTDLEVMHLTSHRIGYIAADSLAKRLSNLRQLTIDACVVSGVLRTFLSNCFKLTYLSFEEDVRFSLRDFWSIIDLCGHLKELRITSYNLHMKSSVIKEVVRRLTSLRRLWVKAYRLYEWDRSWFHRELEVINPDLRISLHYMHWFGDSSVRFELQHYV